MLMTEKLLVWILNYRYIHFFKEFPIKYFTVKGEGGVLFEYIEICIAIGHSLSSNENLKYLKIISWSLFIKFKNQNLNKIIITLKIWCEHPWLIAY